MLIECNQIEAKDSPKHMWLLYSFEILLLCTAPILQSIVRKVFYSPVCLDLLNVRC